MLEVRFDTNQKANHKEIDFILSKTCCLMLVHQTDIKGARRSVVSWITRIIEPVFDRHLKCVSSTLNFEKIISNL